MQQQQQQQNLLWQVYCVCIAEFDILKGNTLSYTYPSHIDMNEEYNSHNGSNKNLGDLCLMDGSHIYKEDMTYLFLKMSPQQLKHFNLRNTYNNNNNNNSSNSSNSNNSNNSNNSSSRRVKEVRLEGEETTEEEEEHNQVNSNLFIYGTVLFQNKKDDTVKRGAIQKSLVLFSLQPLFSVWEPLLRVTLSHIMHHSPNDPMPALEQLYHMLTSAELKQKLSVTLFNETFTIKKPKIVQEYDHDPYLYMGNVSLLSLVKRFKRDVMILWYALLCGKRIMIVGTPAKQVANCCLSCPLLAYPYCREFTKLIYPYVPLTDLDFILSSRSFICGTTNHLFETRQDWWDVCASFTSNQVIVSKQFKHLGTLTARDKEFMMNVLSGIEDGRGEKWVRQQFSQMTYRFFSMIQMDKIPKTENTQMVVNTIMVQTDWYEKFEQYQIQQQQHIINNNNDNNNTISAVDLVRKLMDNEKQHEILDRMKTVFDLSKILNEDVSQVDELLTYDSSIVATVASWLKDDNSQFRKYSASIMASFASCVRGLLAISSHSIQQRHMQTITMIDGENEFKPPVRVLEAIIDLLKDDMPNVRSRGAYTIYKMSNLFIGCKVLLSFTDQNVAETLRRMITSTNDDTVTRTYAALSVAQLYHYLPDIMRRRLKSDWYHEIHDQIFAASDMQQFSESLYHVLDTVLSIESRNCTLFKYSFMTLPVNQRAVEMVANLKKRYKINAVYKKCLLEFTESPNFVLQLVMANAVYALSCHLVACNNISNRQGNELTACTCAQFLTTLSSSEYCKSQILTYGVIEDVIIPVLSNSTVSLFTLSILHLLLSLLVRYEDVAQHFNQVGGMSHLATFILNNYHNPLLAQFTWTAIQCLKITLEVLCRADGEILLLYMHKTHIHGINHDEHNSSMEELWDMQLREEEYDVIIVNDLYASTTIITTSRDHNNSQRTTSVQQYQELFMRLQHLLSNRCNKHDALMAMQQQRLSKKFMNEQQHYQEDFEHMIDNTDGDSDSSSDEDEYDNSIPSSSSSPLTTVKMSGVEPPIAFSLDPSVSSRMSQFFSELNKCRVEDLLREKLSDALSIIINNKS